MDNIPKGYKKTEIGVIPEDWQVNSLGEIGDVKMCRRIFSYETREFGDIPFYKIGTFGKEPDAYISKEQYQKYKKLYDFPVRGDILISASGTIGRTVVYNGKDAYYQDSNIVWIDNDERLVTNSFLNHMFKRVKYDTEGGTIQRLYNSILKAAKIPCPSLPEQVQISKALSDIDSLITSLEQLIEKKKMLKQGVMQELLTGKRRLSGFSGEWKKSPLKILLETPVTDGPHLTPKFVTNGIPFLSVNNIKENTIDVSDLRFITKEDDLEFSRKCKPRKGDILLGKAATVGTVALVENDWDFNIWSPLALIRMKNNLEPRFFYYQLQSNDIYSQIKFLTNSSSQGNLGMSDIEKLEVYSPTREEQVAVSNTLSLIDSDLVLQKAKLSKLKQIKQGAMQQLLTGKIRLINK